MPKSAKTVFYFGVYIMLLGLVLVAMPNLLLSLFHMDATSEVWIRVTGMLLLYLSVYYLYFGRHPHRTFFLLTVYNRATVILFFIAFVWLEMAEPTLLLFSVIDLAAAAWTWLALKQEAGQGQQA